MEGTKELSSNSLSSSQTSQSSSSITVELFGSNKTSPCSASENVFSTIFPPPSKVRTGEFPKFEVNGRKHFIEDEGWNVKSPTSDDDSKNGRSRTWGEHKDYTSYICREQNSQPSNLSSSIFYGGQEIYSFPKDNHSSASSNHISLENGEQRDDSGSASRGDWWQGSLYY